MHRLDRPRRLFNPLPLLRVVSVAAAMACGSTVEQAEPNPSPTPASPTPSNAGSGGTGSAAPARDPATMTSMTPLPVTPPREGNTTPVASDASTAGKACEALGTSDACAACVCGACSSELDACAGTVGCAEILTCVRENGCSGSDCYCGDARLSECFEGGGDGPCKDAVLAAPGSREPTLQHPSAGPATDAALEVADCADEEERCADVCDL